MKNELLLIAIFFIIACSSCTTYRYIYSASPANDPFFTQKGESTLTGYYSTSNDNRILNEFAHGFDLLGAYALSNHFAITTGYFTRNERDVYNFFNRNGPFDSSVINYQRHLIDIGGGYFVFLNQRKKITFNLYGGAAFGNFSFEDRGLDDSAVNYSRYHNSKITKWFFQPAFNFRPGQNFRFSTGLKFSFVRYSNIHTSYTSDELQYFSLNKIENKTIPYVETFLNFQFGIAKFPWIKLDAGLSAITQPSINSSKYPDNARFRLRSRGSNASIGLSFDFSKIKRGNSSNKYR